MPAKRRKRNRKWVSWLVFLVLLVIAGIVAYFVWDGYFREKEVASEETTTKDDEKKVEEVVQVAQPKDEAAVEEVQKEKVVQYEGEDPNEKAAKTGELSGVMTYAGVNGGQLMVRVNIDQYLSGGSCILAIRKDGGNVYTATAAVADSASTSTCEGFNVPVEELVEGHLNIVVFINSGDQSGEIHGEVEL